MHIRNTTTLLVIGLFLCLAACDTSVAPEEPEDCYYPSPMEPDVCVAFASFHAYPAWAPDGNRIAYIRPDPETEIVGMYVFDLTTNKDRRVLHGPGNMSSQAWSPDGAWITFSWGRQIYKIREDGSELTQLTFERENFEPAWSPDGEWIAYADATPVPHDEVSLPDSVLQRGVWLMRPDGSDKHRAWNVDGGIPVWHPQGDRILTAKDIMPGGGQYRLLQNYPFADTPRDTLQIGGDDWGLGRHHSYSPDGRRIVFGKAHKTVYDRNIWKMKVDGSGLERLSEDWGDSPAWSPDGRKIAYVNVYWRERVIWLMDTDGSNKRRLGPVAPPFVPPFSQNTR